jgi:hypothetical protein
VPISYSFYFSIFIYPEVDIDIIISKGINYIELRHGDKKNNQSYRVFSQPARENPRKSLFFVPTMPRDFPPLTTCLFYYVNFFPGKSPT